MKKLISMLLALAMVLCFAACSKTEAPAADAAQTETQTDSAQETTEAAETPAENEKLVIAYSVPSLANEFWVNWTDAMRAECEELGYDFIVEDAKSDVSNQVTQMENWITRGVNAIIIAPVDAEAIQASVDEAMSEGIPVINAATKLTNYTAYVGVDQYYYGEQIGKAAAAWVNENLADKEEVKVAILTDSTQKNMITRTEGIKAGLAEAKNIVIVAEQDAYTSDAGMSAAENILQANPDLDGFVGINDSAMCGAYQATITFGADTTNMFLVACDGNAEALDYIKQGTCYRASVAIDVAATAHLNLWQAIDAAQGKTVEDVKTQVTPVTPENVDAWLQK